MTDVPKLKPIFPPHVMIWFAVGPILILMGLLLERTALTAVGLALTTMSMIGATLTAYLERRRHDSCHRHTEKALDALHRMHTFQVVETVASELDAWSDSFRRQPKGAFISVQAIADGLEERARELRKMAPEPPPVRIDKDEGLLLDLDPPA